MCPTGEVLGWNDDASSAKPQTDWDGPVDREELIDSRAREAFAAPAVLDGRYLHTPGAVGQAAVLVTVVSRVDDPQSAKYVKLGEQCGAPCLLL